MDSFVVQSWINDVVMDANEQPNTPSPSKRPRTDQDNFADEENAYFNLDKTPRTSTRSALSLPTVPIFSAHRQQLSSETSRSLRPQSISPRKRFQTTASLRQLEVPIRFVVEPTLEAVVPLDARPLAAALSAVASGEALLPAVLKSHPDFQNDSRIRWYTWCDETTTATRPASSSSTDNNDNEHAAALRNYDQLRAIINMSVESSNMQRSEAAWNNFVHTPFLLLAGLRMPRLRVEVITSAQIMPAFRPLLLSGQKVPVPSSETSSAGGDSSVSGYSGPNTLTRRGAGGSGCGAAMSVHKMVDYALVLRPSDTLQALINSFLQDEPWERGSINQTRYEPLRAQPAPIFIETKTTAGTKDSASVQLGIWVAAWLRRMRNLAEQAGSKERMLTLPVIQVVRDAWSVLFVVDEGTHIRVLHDNRSIGNTTSVLDIYKLQASMIALGRWVDETFTPWFADLLTRAVENRDRYSIIF